jgi:hypothetical protein
VLRHCEFEFGSCGIVDLALRPPSKQPLKVLHGLASRFPDFVGLNW